MNNQDSLSNVFSEVLKKLEEHHVEFMIVGSIAAVVYGEPRLTKAMDLVIDIPPQIIRKFESIFPLTQYYCPPLEVLQDEHLRRGQFNIIHHASGLKVDFVFRKNTPHSQTEFDRRRRIELWPGLKVPLAAPEDIIIKKLEYYREGQSPKHLLDIKGILAGTEVDSDYLQKWVNEMALTNEWQAALKS